MSSALLSDPFAGVHRSIGKPFNGLYGMLRPVRYPDIFDDSLLQTSRRPMDEVPDGGNVTRLLIQWREGSDDALNRLMPLVYNELHRIASRHLRNERESATLQTTVLIHEAYMRLVGADVHWEGRKHFLAIASRTMRRILVDHARARSRVKRGGPDAVSVTMSDAFVADGMGIDNVDIIALDLALEKLAGFDERKAKIVELHFFGGLRYDELAEVMGISEATVHRDLRMAKSWLYTELRPG